MMGRSSPQPAVSLLDPVGQYERLRPEIDARIATVLGHGRFVNGPEVAELETALAARSGAKHVVAVANGTDALNIALRAERIGPGDAVFVPAFSFVATGGAVALNGATPIFVDINPRTFVMDPTVLADTIRHVRSAGNLVPRAVMPVDLFGLPADYRRLGTAVPGGGAVSAGRWRPKLWRQPAGPQGGRVWGRHHHEFLSQQAAGCMGRRWRHVHRRQGTHGAVASRVRARNFRGPLRRPADWHQFPS